MGISTQKNVSKLLPLLVVLLLPVLAILLAVTHKDKNETPQEGSVNVTEEVVSTETGTSTATTTTPTTPAGTTKVTTSVPTSQPKTPATTPVQQTPAVPQTPQSSDYINELLAGNSKRCEWVDPSNGVEGLALIKEGNLRLEKTDKGGNKIITIYNAIATYLWTDGEKRGTIIPNSAVASTPMVQTKTQVATFLVTNERVRCSPAALSDGHFVPPKDVTFLGV